MTTAGGQSKREKRKRYQVFIDTQEEGQSARKCQLFLGPAKGTEKLKRKHEAPDIEIIKLPILERKNR